MNPKHKHLLLLSLLSGLLLAAAWPARGFTPLVFVALIPLLAVQHHLGNTGGRGMFWYAWLSFIVWNGLTTWWIWNSTAPGAVAAIVFNALFSAVVFQVYHISKKRLFDNKRGFGILIFYWISWEYFHNNWELTWPWLTLGNVFSTKAGWIQWYEYTGVFGGSFWVLWVNVLLFQTFVKWREKKKKPALLHGSLAFLLLLVPVLYSQYLFNRYTQKENPVEVVVVQPNIDPYTEEFSLPPSLVMERIFHLADSVISDTTQYVVCPESAIQEGIWEEQMYRSKSINLIRQYLGKHPAASFVIGASTFRWVNKGEPLTNAARPYKGSYFYAFNTAMEIDTLPFIQVHHKSKLTPGVERMPSWRILKPLEKYAIDLGGISGTLKDEDHLTVFTKPGSGWIIAPAICYESVFGEFVAKTVSLGAQAVFVITNDGWWGNTPGYRQHFYLSVLRAIETRRYVVRSANTGISGIINAKGEVLKKTPYWKRTAFRAVINMNNQPTFYMQYGDYIARISGFISFFILIIAFTQGFLNKKKSLF